MARELIETITLQEPVTVTLKRAGEDEREHTISTLEVYRFRAKFLRALDHLADDAKGSQLIALMARMTDQPVKVIDELGGPDFQRLAEVVEPFLPKLLATGGAS